MSGRPKLTGWEPAFFAAFASMPLSRAAKAAGTSPRTVGRRIADNRTFRTQFIDVATEKLKRERGE